MTSLIPQLPIQTQLTADFPTVHPDAHFQLDFMRTLRIPDDGRDYPLPAGLGRFPMVPIADLGPRAPRSWHGQRGVALPMYQAEAMWMMFRSPRGYPFAVKVLAGGIDAVSGEDWAPGLRSRTQNYIAVPEQPWLDGFCVSKGRIRQFVAARLGEGHTVEEKLTGGSDKGGLQIVVIPMKAARWEALREARSSEVRNVAKEYLSINESTVEMGLAAGGTMIQEIYTDPHGLDAWEQDAAITCNVRIVQAQGWQALTGRPVPHAPITKERYQAAGIPWFGYFDADLDVVSAQGRLAGMGGAGVGEGGEGEDGGDGGAWVLGEG